MKITIQYYGQSRDMAGIDSEMIEASSDAIVSYIVEKAVEARGENLQKLLLSPDGGVRPSVLVSVNDEIVASSGTTKLKDGDHISLFTAMAGG